jgi:hypothetical protein
MLTMVIAAGRKLQSGRGGVCRWTRDENRKAQESVGDQLQHVPCRWQLTSCLPLLSLHFETRMRPTI